MKDLDCIGLSCPMPVVNTKKALKVNPDGLNVLVDNVCAKENVSRFATNSGYGITVTQTEGIWKIEIRK